MKTAVQRIQLLFRKTQQKLILTFSAFILLLNLLSLYATLTISRVSNDECIWYPVKSVTGEIVFVFRDVKPDGVTEKAGIRNGDTLIYINGKKLISPAHAQQLLNRMEEGDFAVYTVASANSVFVTRVEIKKLILFDALAFGLMALFWFSVSFILILSSPDGEVQRLFFKIGISFSIFRSFPVFSPYLPSIYDSPFFIGYLFCFITMSTMLGYWLIRFFSIFPARLRFTDNAVSRYLLKAVTLVVLGLSYYRFLDYLIDVPFVVAPQTIDMINANYFVSIPAVFSVTALLAGLIFLLINYSRLRDRKNKKPISGIVWAYLLTVAGLVYTSIVAPRLGYVVYNSPEYFMPIIIIVLLPIAFAYSVFKYQLFDVSHVVKVTLAYGTATILLGIVYLLSVYSLGRLIGAIMPVQYQGLMTFVFFIVFAFVFQPTKDKLQEIITKRFYPEQDAYQKAMIHLPYEMAKTVGLENIFNVIHTLFVDKIRIDRYALLLPATSKTGFTMVKSYRMVSPQLFVSFEPVHMIQYLDEKRASGKRPVIEEDEFEYVFSTGGSDLRQAGIFTIVPLLSGNKLNGVFLLGLKYSGSKFVGKDLDLLISVSIQSSIAIENARLYFSEMEKLRIEQDLNIARDIQMNLLPRKMPEYPQFDIWGEMIPALQVGGDYFDFIPYKDEGLFIVIGDVSGKGLSASLYMSKIQTLVKMFCNTSSSPKAVLTELNVQMGVTLDKRTFATMSVGFIDFRRGVMNFCRAGHVPLLAKTNACITTIDSDGIALGLDRTYIFQKTLREIEIPLLPGQTFVFYSDGIDEAMDEQMRCFGRDSLATIILDNSYKTSQDLAAGIISKVRDFQGNSSQSDDMTVVVMRVNDKPVLSTG